MNSKQEAERVSENTHFIKWMHLRMNNLKETQKVCLSAEWLEDDLLKQITAESNLSEIAFL